MIKSQIIRFNLNLNYQQYIQVYQGTAKNVSILADDGRRITFPARNIQSFLNFEMELTAENKFISIKKLS